jgi:primosomal protein N'
MVYRPLPCPIDKIQNRYRWRIILKGKLNNKIIDIINQSISIINSKTTRIVVDTNPTSLV